MSQTDFNCEGIESNKVQTELIKCSSCGSNMIFDPDLQCLFCEHCNSKVLFDNDEIANEQDITSLGFNKDNVWSKDETSIFRCDNCGASVVLQKNETATSCPFCGTAHVTKVEELEGLKPNALIPFSFGDDKAIEITKEWARKKLFAPRKFKKNIKTDNVKGVYAPCFTFDSSTTSIYVGRIGKRYTRVVGSGKNRRVESYIVWRNISGTYYNQFDDILITAGSKLGQKQIDKLSPYDTNASKKFNQNYMLGFMAYHYDSELSECWSQAKDRIDSVLKQKILSQYFYDVVDYIKISTTHEHVTYKYVMLPVYVGNFIYNKKPYNFYVNGNTGKVCGKTPKSIFKILLTCFLCVAAVVGITLLAL